LTAEDEKSRGDREKGKLHRLAETRARHQVRKHGGLTNLRDGGGHDTVSRRRWM
jgi:hypothetical protein